MPKLFADLHLHSNYGRSVSKHMTLGNIAGSAQRKGIKLVAAPDWSHPKQLEAIKKELIEDGEGIFKLRGNISDTRFMLSSEVSCNTVQAGITHKTHLLVLSPSIEVVEKINHIIKTFGNLEFDGRPTLIISPRFFVKYILDISFDCMIIVPHILTPWFGCLGFVFGYNSLEECFGDELKNIHAVETGLSADPNMVTKILGDRYSILSFGDAHSLAKIGRELTAFDCELSYPEITRHIKEKKQLFTVEFFPQMGKYFLSGHRDCKTSRMPEQSHGVEACPTCGKRFTQGVAYRTWQLQKYNLDPPPIKYAIPLLELTTFFQRTNKSALLEKTGAWHDTRYTASQNYERYLKLATEVDILLAMSAKDLRNIGMSKELINYILQVRHGNVSITPGYDGIFGEIEFKVDQMKKDIENEDMKQMSFDDICEDFE